MFIRKRKTTCIIFVNWVWLVQCKAHNKQVNQLCCNLILLFLPKNKTKSFKNMSGHMLAGSGSPTKASWVMGQPIFYSGKKIQV